MSKVNKANKEDFTNTEQGGSMKSGDKCSSPDKVVTQPVVKPQSDNTKNK